MFKSFILTWNQVCNKIKLFKRQTMALLLRNVLAKSNVLENIHEAKLLQTITAHVESHDILM